MLHGNVPSWREFITIISSILAVVLTSPFLQIKRNSDLELGFVIWEYYSKVRWKCVFFLPHSNCNICQTSHLIWTVINNVLCIWEYAKKKKKKISPIPTKLWFLQASKSAARDSTSFNPSFCVNLSYTPESPYIYPKTFQRSSTTTSPQWDIKMDPIKTGQGRQLAITLLSSITHTKKLNTLHFTSFLLKSASKPWNFFFRPGEKSFFFCYFNLMHWDKQRCCEVHLPFMQCI